MEEVDSGLCARVPALLGLAVLLTDFFLQTKTMDLVRHDDDRRTNEFD